MIGIFLFLTALIGSALASFFDLRTTEIPDEIPYAMMGIGILVHLIQAILVWNSWPFINSLIFGLGFLGFGFLLYFLGQWGGGDAKILSGIGFLLPRTPQEMTVKLYFPFPLSFLFNLFFIGAFYMILYALVMSFIDRKIWLGFLKGLKADAKILVALNFILFFLSMSLGIVSMKYYNLLNFEEVMSFSLLLLSMSLGLSLLWKFVKAVEEIGFKKRIPISKLKVGDVPVYYKIWEGITEKELRRIKQSGKKYIWIKEGVRFAPAFPLALLFTFFLGDAVVWFAYQLV